MDFCWTKRQTREKETRGELFPFFTLLGNKAERERRVFASVLCCAPWIAEATSHTHLCSRPLCAAGGQINPAVVEQRERLRNRKASCTHAKILQCFYQRKYQSLLCTWDRIHFASPLWKARGEFSARLPVRKIHFDCSRLQIHARPLARIAGDFDNFIAKNTLATMDWSSFCHDKSSEGGENETPLS